MYDQLTGVDPGNLVDAVDSLEGALFAVCDAFARFGQAGGDGLALSKITTMAGAALSASAADCCAFRSPRPRRGSPANALPTVLA